MLQAPKSSLWCIASPILIAEDVINWFLYDVLLFYWEMDEDQICQMSAGHKTQI